jgi:hypothetical protein
MDERIEAAERAWPGVSVDRVSFAQRLSDDTTHVEELYLATGCGEG